MEQEHREEEEAWAGAEHEALLVLLGKRQPLRAADSRNDPCANAVLYHLTQK